MAEPTSPDTERAARDVLTTTAENQAATFRNQDQVWPVRVIRRSDAVRPERRRRGIAEVRPTTASG